MVKEEYPTYHLENFKSKQIQLKRKMKNFFKSKKENGDKIAY